MNTSKLIAIAAALFPHYPKVEKFFITSDGQAFEKEHDAVNHSRSFKDEDLQKISEVTREDVERYGRLKATYDALKADAAGDQAPVAPAAPASNDVPPAGDQAPAAPGAPAVGDQAPAAPAVPASNDVPPAGDQAPAAPGAPAAGDPAPVAPATPAKSKGK